jgi:hypothetical protein
MSILLLMLLLLLYNILKVRRLSCSFINLGSWGRHLLKDNLNLAVLEHILKLNNFMFNDEHYSQVSDTAMGSKMAPSYVNICRGKLECNLHRQSIFQPLSWLLFIVDIEMKWTRRRR